jgi:hypothetical protein
MSFSGVPESVGEVRRYLVNVLGPSCGIEPLIVGTELATNAIRHTASGGVGGQFVVHVDRYLDRLGLRVDDQGGPSSPRLLESGDLGDGGRGLIMVAELCLAWGVLGDDRSRTVWAELALPSRHAFTDVPHQQERVIQPKIALARAVGNEIPP